MPSVAGKVVQSVSHQFFLSSALLYAAPSLYIMSATAEAEARAVAIGATSSQAFEAGSYRSTE